MALARTSMASKMAAPVRAGRVARAAVRVNAKAGNWLPGSAQPAWLPENLPGTYGFDPLGLAKEPKLLERYTEAELIHCRWAMLGAAGALAVEVLGYGNWVDAQSQVITEGRNTYFGAVNPLDLNTNLAVFFVAFATAEGIRGANADVEKKKYPGIFDPLGLASGANAEKYKLNEIKNGRLAMLAFLGFIAQYGATGKTPLENLKDHLANPWYNNFATNGVSIPGL